MSNQGVLIAKTIFRFSFGCPVILSVRNISRRGVEVKGPYKVVKSKRIQDEKPDVWKDINFEFLTSTKYPYFMPGNVGPAWYDTHSTVNTEGKLIMELSDSVTDSMILCRAQTCPKVLRSTVCDLFPNRNLQSSELSVITISLKCNAKLYRRNKELETEKLAQTFVLTAKNVCNKLRKAGYWADFVNPFSGKPYFASFGHSLYETDEKFRCLDFEIYEIKNCIIISNEQESAKKPFIGSLFTNAPSKLKHLTDIFTKL